MPLALDDPRGDAHVAADAPVGDAPVLLRVRGLSKAYGGATLLRAIDIELRRGEVVLLEGENGSGKTTLINILTGNIEPDSGTIDYLVDGRRHGWRFPRRWWRALDPRSRFSPEFVARHGIGRTWQDIRLFGTQTLLENIALFDARHPDIGPLGAILGSARERAAERAAEASAEAALARLGLAGRAESSADAISLGQSQRVAIARTVAAGARILFLDEPLSGLDSAGVADVIGLLDTLVRESGLTLVIVEHVLNHAHLRPLVTTSWRLADGSIERRSEAASARGASLQPIARARPSWMEQLAATATTVHEETMERGARLTRMRFDAAVSTAPVLEIRRMVVARGRRTVIGRAAGKTTAGFDLALQPGELAILEAPNGWGKSSLLQAISGILRPVEGEVLLTGEVISHLPTWQRVRRGLRTLLADQHGFPHLSVGEILRLSRAAASTIGLDVAPDRLASTLSGGERQLLSLLGERSDGVRPTVRLFDEPFAMLDKDAVMHALAIVRPGAADAVLIAIPSIGS